MITQRVRQLARRFSKDQRGITGLETAIVLVAFVLVASVFAYAVLNTGLFASDRSKQSVNAGLKQTTSTLETRGSVIAEGNPGSTVDHVYQVHVVLASAPGGDPISLDPKDLAITYSDSNQVKNLDTTNDLTTTWIVGGDTSNPSGNPTHAPANKMMSPGDVVEMVINLGSLSNSPNTPLRNNTNFTLEIKPKVGAVITVNRTTPSAIDKVMNLN